jgi:membrane-bound inhibitor of C-type lysozyme
MGKHDSRRCVTIAASVLLTACAGAGAGDGGGKTAIEAVFVCGTDIAYTRFENQGMTLKLGPKDYVLAQARSGSGARYTGDSADGPVEFWNKGRDARLTIGSRTYPECHQQGETR